MKIMPASESRSPARRWLASGGALRPIALLAYMALPSLLPVCTRAQSDLSSRLPAAWNITIVLPPRVVAGRPATLAVFGADGKLAADVNVDLDGIQRVQTNQTGRAYFVAPARSSVLIAYAAGASAAALVDAAVPSDHSAPLHVEPVVSVHDAFPICGALWRGDADANHAKINGEPALILAASPECLVVLPPPNAVPGPARISLDAPGVQVTAVTTFVSLDFLQPSPPLIPKRKSALPVRVRGSGQPLHIVVTNETPGILRFARGDEQESLTSGGVDNLAEISVTALRSGDFSFRARILPAPDLPAAQRFLAAALPLSSRDLRSEIKDLGKRLARHPRDSEKIRAQLNWIASQTMEGNFRALLVAASRALG